MLEQIIKIQVRSHLQSICGVGMAGRTLANLDESVREGFGVIQEEQDGWNEFGKQSIASIDKKNHLTQTQHIFFRPLLSGHPEQTADPLQVLPLQIPPRLLRPVLLRVLPLPLAANLLSRSRRVRRSAER